MIHVHERCRHAQVSAHPTRTTLRIDRSAVGGCTCDTFLTVLQLERSGGALCLGPPQQRHGVRLARASPAHTKATHQRAYDCLSVGDSLGHSVSLRTDRKRKMVPGILEFPAHFGTPSVDVINIISPWTRQRSSRVSDREAIPPHAHTPAHAAVDRPTCSWWMEPSPFPFRTV